MERVKWNWEDIRKQLFVSDGEGMFNSEGKLKMSAKQIKDFFALENIPDKLVIVELPKNTILEVSIVGPQESWGKTLGGGVQFAFPYAKYETKWFEK